MSRVQQISKGLKLLRKPAFAAAALRHRIAATTEHLEAIRLCGAKTLIDIGANKGQFSLAYRSIRPDGRIIAFEPFQESADRFEGLFATDDSVTLHRCALADEEGEAEFHVTTRRDSSSLLTPGQGQSDAFDVQDEMVIRVPVKRLDKMVAIESLTGPILIKIDVQGAELKVLQGCDTLERADFLYVELSFVELYEKQPLFGEVTNYLFGRGFDVAGVFNQALTTEFGPTQVDVLFHRKTA